MNALAIIQLILVLLEGVLQSANLGGYTKIAEAASNAIKELQQVHGTEVTKGQLEALQVTPTWPSPAQPTAPTA